MLVVHLTLLLTVAVKMADAAGSSRRKKPTGNNSDMIKDLRSQVHFLRERLNDCSCQIERQMDIFFLDNNKVACNDRSPSGYYLRSSEGSKIWIIYLEGGGYCYDEQMCNERFSNLDEQPHMTSDRWRPKKTGTGILSASIEENPSWWNANAVFVPYCSSDVWSGNQTFEDAKNGYVFMGARIIREVVEELLTKGMMDARQILLAGSSAGGVGVMLNIDRVARQVKEAGSKAEVRGLSDSGWFVDCNRHSKKTCGEKGLPCTAGDAIKRGYSYWNACIPEKCLSKHARAPWKCFFGETVYPHVETEVFVSQWLFDKAQMDVCNMPFPNTKKQFKQLLKLGAKVRKSLRNVRHVFAPSCLSHNLVINKDWTSYKIRDATLPKVFDCWFPKFGAKKRKCGRMRNIDNCTYLPCNKTCPIITHPYTGAAVDISKLTKVTVDGRQQSTKHNPSEQPPY
eukprot:m.13707 g.13707  ORF g.13707 m.13707 type:complete len:454 (+) comp25158_c0_seq2:2226-3587(+)